MSEVREDGEDDVSDIVANLKVASHLPESFETPILEEEEEEDILRSRKRKKENSLEKEKLVVE
jgi:hypothetical protein